MEVFELDEAIEYAEISTGVSPSAESRKANYGTDILDA
jgi:hypothetical protein